MESLGYQLVTPASCRRLSSCNAACAIIVDETLRLSGAPLHRPAVRRHVSRGRAGSSPRRAQVAGTGTSPHRGRVSGSKAGTCVKPPQAHRAGPPKPAGPRGEGLGVLLSLSHVHRESTPDVLTPVTSPSLLCLRVREYSQGTKGSVPLPSSGVTMALWGW